MSDLKFRKVNALPGTLEADALYLVKSPDTAYAEIHISNSDGSSSKRLPTKQDVVNLIASEGGGTDFDGLSTVFVTTSPFELVPSSLHIVLTDSIPVELVLPVTISPDTTFGLINASNRTDHWVNRNGHLIDQQPENIESLDVLNIPLTLKYLNVTYGVIAIISLQGIIAGNTLTGNGNALFNLNASNLASGTVPLGRLGTGTPDTTKFLRGDNSWFVPTVNLLAATASIGSVFSATTTGAYAGTFNGFPTVAFSNSAAPVDNRSVLYRQNNDGSFGLYLSNDALNSFTGILTVTRSANTATDISLVSNSLSLNTRVDFLKSYTEKDNTLAATATTTIDCSLGNIHSLTLGVNITTLAFSNVPASGRVFSLTLFLQQDATGGRTITFPASVKWPGNVAPTLSGANKVDIVTLVTKNAGATWFGMVGGQNF